MICLWGVGICTVWQALVCCAGDASGPAAGRTARCWLQQYLPIRIACLERGRFFSPAFHVREVGCGQAHGGPTFAAQLATEGLLRVRCGVVLLLPPDPCVRRGPGLALHCTAQNCLHHHQVHRCCVSLASPKVMPRRE